ncbi:MAG: NAD(P)/FAD-dependent oxidoreductase [Candidatus Hodarchaeales archaeon]|jgi:thioredoxin reductase
MVYYEVIIIGGGPAGIATAIQLQRSGVNTLVIEKDQIGGLLKNANLVENYPGFPEGISGLELIKEFAKQLTNLNVAICKEEVKNLEYNYEENKFLIFTEKTTYSSMFLVIASGTKPKLYPHPIPESIMRKIHYEWYSLRHEENNEIVVIGGGDLAFDQAINLAKRNKVMILNRSENIKCLPILFERAKNNEQITYFSKINELKMILDKDKIRISGIQESQNVEFLCDHILIAIGRLPNRDFIPKRLENEFLELSNLNKLFMIGDVKNNHFRQVSIATGEGIKIAMKIVDLLSE